MLSIQVNLTLTFLEQMKTRPVDFVDIFIFYFYSVTEANQSIEQRDPFPLLWFWKNYLYKESYLSL